MTLPPQPIRVANAPCSWGVLEYEEHAAAGYDASTVLTEMAAAGYEGTELGDWGFMPTDPAALRALLTAKHLSLVGAFVPVRLTDPSAIREGEAMAARTARLLAASGFPDAFIVLADDVAADEGRTAAAGRLHGATALASTDRARLAAHAERIARAAREETGARTVFHHHCATFVETPDEISDLMRRTDPATLGLCLDTGHLTYAGGDAVALAGELQDRIWHVHLKDCDAEVATRARAEGWSYPDAVRHGVFCELGRGIVRFDALLDRLVDRGFRGWAVVEQDVLPALGTPAASARRNRLFLRGLGL